MIIMKVLIKLSKYQHWYINYNATYFMFILYLIKYEHKCLK